MAGGRQPLELPASAELQMVRLVRRVMVRAQSIVAAEVAESWPEVDLGALRRRLARELLPEGELGRSLRVVARIVEVSIQRQLAALVGRSLPPGSAAEVALDWQREAFDLISSLLVGGRADSARVDGVLSLVERVGQAVRSGAESAADAVTRARRAAARQVRVATSQARASVLRLGARVNRTLQAAARVRRYRWVTRRDGRVRERHAELDGSIQRWDQPPVISDDGRRGHPGEDYNCRCVAVPV